MSEVDPGEIPRLDPDEGLLVLAVDANMDVDAVKVRRVEGLFGTEKISDLPEGRSFRLFVAKAGNYAWTEIRPFHDLWFDLRKADHLDFNFKVRAGTISYPGDFVFRGGELEDVKFHVSNRSLGAIDWLARKHPALYARYALEYSGSDPDPFPAFYREQVEAAAGTEKGALRAPPKPGRMPLAVRDLWKDSRVVQARMNSAGDLIAVEVRKAEDDWSLELVDLEAGAVSVIARSDVEFGGVTWSGDRTLIVPSIDLEDQSIVRIGELGPKGRSFDRLDIRRQGWVVDSLDHEPDRILFASWDSKGQLMVHRLDISSQAAIDRFGFKFADRLNTYVSRDRRWYTDAAGNLRMAIVARTMKDEEGEEETRYALIHGIDGRFSDVLLLDKDEPLNPVGVSADGNRIYAIAEKARSQKELVEIDPGTGKIVRTVFARDGVDVVNALFDERHELAGALYYQGGRLVSEYFDAERDSQAGMLRAAFPGKNVVVAGRSRDNLQMLLWVESGDQPAQLYHLDVAERRASLVDEAMPWIDTGKLAPTHRLEVVAADGLRIEAFLTMPAGKGKRPLVVYPHGGPIGISDRNHFDPSVQFLASLGYAVLRVNFRGSEGYGRAFQEAGHKEYGHGIEDDIDAAIREAIAAHPVDGNRMCTLGTSYGGFSSLVSAVRWPERFRCVVSIAGPSDRILAFSASDYGRNKKGRPVILKIMGDPATDQERMRSVSPIYRYRDLEAAVMLAHGREDLRVDYEHMARLHRMLALDGRPPVGLVFDDEAHSLEDIDNIESLWHGVAGFLAEHLGAGTTSAMASSAASAPVDKVGTAAP
jgi:dipeptidyl aminopeptidase/acylaminoacyl peptidase